MSVPDKATVEMVAKIRTALGLLNSMVNGGEQHSQSSRGAFHEAMDALEHIAALPTPTDAGLVEALEFYAEKRHYEGRPTYIDRSLDSVEPPYVIEDEGEQARQALANHRAGNPWSDEVPTVPGLYWWRLNGSTPVPIDISHRLGTQTFGKWSDGSMCPTDIKGQWCKATPPEGS